MKNESSPSRRRFLQASVALPAAVAGISGSKARAAEPAGAPAATDSPALPKRKLGARGPEVTILNIGGMMSAYSPQYLDIAWGMGIRYFDTADCYIKGKSEETVARWIAQYPERRDALFLVTKDHPREGPRQLLEMIDRRLEKCGTDSVDLFFIHGLGPKEYGDGSFEWPKSNELKDVFAEIKESGKAKLCGFSCHDDRLVDYLHAAAEGGFVDAIMLRYNPLHEKGGDFDRAVEACHQAGIGLVAMKEMRAFAKAPKNNPAFEPLGLTTQQAALHQVWSDRRIASVCSSMENVQQIEENTLAARTFKGDLPAEQRDALQQVAGLSPVPMCPGCPGCESWARRTRYAFCDVSRYLTYYEQDGDSGARDLFRRLSRAERDYSALDLGALRDACQFKVDYPEIARRAERYFA